MAKFKNGGDLMLPPHIDDRDLSALIEQMKEMVPYYTPEWRFSPEDPDPGTALFLIVAEMLQENIKRLNDIPQKNFMAFLNIFDVSLITAKPAQAYVTFVLSEGSQDSVFVPAGTQITAPPPEGEEDVIIYETEKNMLVTPALLSDTFSISTNEDVIIRTTDQLVPKGEHTEIHPTTLFDFSESGNRQEHSLYLAHDDILNILHGASIEIQIHTAKQYKDAEYCSILANPELVEWMYSSNEEWITFDSVSALDNTITLFKNQDIPIERLEINGQYYRWIKCHVKSMNIASGLSQKETPEIDTLQIKADYWDHDKTGGLTPDLLFNYDIEVDPQGFYPFGENFAPYSTFYISSQEVFSKKEASIRIDFDLKCIPNAIKLETVPEVEWKLLMKKSKFDVPEAIPIYILKVLWEYWNGKAWVKLTTSKEAEEIFYKPNEPSYTIRFKCPREIEETFVNAHLNYWIRGRILTIENLYAPDSVYLSPWIEHMVLSYSYGDQKYPVDYCLTLNNMEYHDRTLDTKSKGTSFKLFYPMDCEYPALYFGFESAPLKGPISIYFSFKQTKFKEDQLPLIEWEYCIKKGYNNQWLTLKVIDETKGFTVNGTVQFAGPPELAKASYFGRTLFWIRAVNRDYKMEQHSAYQPHPIVNGIHFNCIRVIQHESINGEIPGSLTGNPHDIFTLARTPVASEKVWIDETGHLTENEISELEAMGQTKVNIIRDTEGHIQRSWVLWVAVDDFLDSTDASRHYMINRSSGIIRFGTGKYGKIPPNYGADKVKVNYKTVGGKKGNVEKNQITTLQHSIAFINSVYNIEAAGGGCDMETLDQALHRGPQMIKHRDRAVTAEDYEWLAREAFPNIAKVKCLANYNVNLQKEIGCVTLVILAKGGRAGSVFFPELKKKVEKALLEKAASTVSFAGNIQVIEPAYIEISVSAVLVVNSMDDVIPVELESTDKLNVFLDPYTGNYDKNGWDIGQHIHISIFYALLKSIHEVNHIEKLSMTVVKKVDGQVIEVELSELGNIVHGIVTNGNHKVVVKSL